MKVVDVPGQHNYSLDAGCSVMRTFPTESRDINAWNAAGACSSGYEWDTGTLICTSCIRMDEILLACPVYNQSLIRDDTLNA